MATLLELKLNLKAHFPGAPDVECQEFIRAACQVIDDWIYTDDSELSAYYDYDVYVVDGKQQLAYHDGTGWTVEESEELEIDKGDYLVTVREDSRNFYISCTAKIGVGTYPKAVWDFPSALDDFTKI